MKRFTLLLLMFGAICMAACSNIPVQTELAEQNEANAVQVQDDIQSMADMLDKAAVGDNTWKETWDDPNEADPDLKGAIRSSIEKNAEANVTSAKEIVEIAKLNK